MNNDAQHGRNPCISGSQGIGSLKYKRTRKRVHRSQEATLNTARTPGKLCTHVLYMYTCQEAKGSKARKAWSEYELIIALEWDGSWAWIRFKLTTTSKLTSHDPCGPAKLCKPRSQGLGSSNDLNWIRTTPQTMDLASLCLISVDYKEASLVQLWKMLLLITSTPLEFSSTISTRNQSAQCTLSQYDPSIQSIRTMDEIDFWQVSAILAFASVGLAAPSPQPDFTPVDHAPPTPQTNYQRKWWDQTRRTIVEMKR